MDFDAPREQQAMTLLYKILQIGEWVKAGDPRAKPYLDAEAVCVVNGEPLFNRQRFIECYAAELVSERMAGVDRMIALTKQILNQGA